MYRHSWRPVGTRRLGESHRAALISYAMEVVFLRRGVICRLLAFLPGRVVDARAEAADGSEADGITGCAAAASFLDAQNRLSIGSRFKMDRPP